jgi:hypothetical protein
MREKDIGLSVDQNGKQHWGILAFHVQDLRWVGGDYLGILKTLNQFKSMD